MHTKRTCWQRTPAAPGSLRRHSVPRPCAPQVKEEAASVAALCGAELAASAVAGDAPLRALCATAGQLVVTTPAKLAQVLREGILTPRMLEERLQVLVLDEADLLLSYGCAAVGGCLVRGMLLPSSNRVWHAASACCASR